MERKLTAEQQSELDNRFMQAAIFEAQEAFDANEVPVGAIITVGDKIIARGHNLTCTLNDVTAHAEMQAITAAANYLGGKYLTQCTLYVTVEPCLMCAGALAWSQIKRIVYGTPDPKKGYTTYFPAGESPLHPKTEVVSGIMADECSRLMRDFFKKLR